MQVIKVWHGSLTPDIKSFKVLSHLGTKLQACHAILTKAAIDCQSGEPRIYGCELGFDPGELQEVADIGAPFGRAIYFSYCKAMKQDERFDSHLDEARQRGLGREASEWVEWLQSLARSSGHRVLQYENLVEGLGTSYCLLDVQAITAVTECPLSWQEFASFYRAEIEAADGFRNKQSNTFKRFLASRVC